MFTTFTKSNFLPKACIYVSYYGCLLYAGDLDYKQNVENSAFLQKMLFNQTSGPTAKMCAPISQNQCYIMSEIAKNCIKSAFIWRKSQNRRQILKIVWNVKFEIVCCSLL